MIATKKPFWVIVDENNKIYEDGGLDEYDPVYPLIYSTKAGAILNKEYPNHKIVRVKIVDYNGN